MKRNLLPSALSGGMERLRHIAMLLVMALCATGTAHALESDDINTAILAEGSVIPKWTDDATNPWVLSEDGTYISAPNTPVTTTLSMTFSSEYQVEFNFDYYFYQYSNNDKFTVIIDGKESTIDHTYNWRSARFVLDPGEHNVNFVSIMADSNSHLWLSNIAIKEYKPLETACVKEGSMPLTFVNDPENPWLTDNGFIQSKTTALDESTSTISTKFTIDKPSLFTYEIENGYNSSCDTKVRINGIAYDGLYGESKSKYNSVVLYPGEYTIEFEQWHKYSGNSKWTKLRNVSLTQDWIAVNVQPGELAVRLLQALGDKNLQDAELVQISGSLNDTDWSTIGQLTGIKAIDFTGSDIASIPDGAFNGKSGLSTVMLPETVKTIGASAFKNTNFYEMRVPASVEIIDNEAWYGSTLRYITFAENSNLTTIGHSAFRGTDIMEFDMPDSVTSLKGNITYSNNPGYTFNDCNKLKKLYLSDALEFLPYGLAYNCSNLTEVHMPANATKIGGYAFSGTSNLRSIEFPDNLTTISDYAFYESGLESVVIPKNVSSLGQYAFYRCSNLKEAYLNSHCSDMYYTFNQCTALQKVVLPCATPPTISYDPFYKVSKSQIQLIVPDFALQSYRSDNYWYNFTNTVAGDEASIRDYWAIRGNLVLDSTREMQATPSVEIMTGGTMTIDTDLAQGFNEFTYNTSEAAPAAYLSNSNNVMATSLSTSFNVPEANKWYFFSPVCDINMADVTYPATDSWVIRYYDGERRGVQNDNSGNWINVPADGVLRKGQGYIIQTAAAGWLHMPVAAEKHNDFFGSNEVNHTLADNPSEGEANAGWNFVANPYPCYYDIYYIDMQAPITVWTGSTYRAYSLNDGDRGDDTFVLRPMQPFFVQKAAADLATGMPLTGRRINTVIDRTRAPKREMSAPNPLRNLLNLELLKGDSEEADDYTRVVINEEASLDYERTCDASKFMSMDTKVAQLFSLGSDNLPMAINERPYDNGIVLLGVYFPTAGESYSISATRADRQVWIYDAETGIEHDLTEGDYFFTSTKTESDHSRFSLRFSPNVTSVGSVDGEQVKVSAANGVITVAAPEDAAVAVYTTDGAIIANATGSAEVNAPAGVYLVKVNGETFKTIVK